MNDILHSNELKFERCSFTIDIVKEQGVYYANVRQHFKKRGWEVQEVKLREAYLVEMSKQLLQCASIIKEHREGKKKLNDEEVAKAVKLYLKGMTIEAIAKYFRLAVRHIEDILLDHGLPIVDNAAMPDTRPSRRWRRKVKK